MNKKEIADTLRNYFWMVNEIKRQRGLLEDAGTNLVAQSGIESSLPKAKGDPGDPVGREVIRRDKKHTWISKLEKKVSFVQKNMGSIEDEREKAVLECLLDGMSMIAISRHMGLSERHIYVLRDRVVDRMAENAGNAGNTGKMQKNRQACHN